LPLPAALACMRRRLRHNVAMALHDDKRAALFLLQQLG
jgi:hypothetical protein